MCHLQYLQHQHHHLLHANCHSFGNYFRTLSAPMATTRTPIMYLAALKAASASNWMHLFWESSPGNELEHILNWIWNTHHSTFAYMNHCNSHHSIWRHFCPTGQTERQTDHTVSHSFICGCQEDFCFKGASFAAVVTLQKGKNKVEARIVTFKHKIHMLYRWSIPTGIKGIIISSSI